MVSEEKVFRNCPIRNQNCLWRPCLSTDRDEMSSLYSEPPIDASSEVSVHMAKWFQRRIFFRNWPIRNKNCLWRSCLLTDRDEMSNLYNGPSIDASYQVSVHLAKHVSEEKVLRNCPIRNQNCLWRPCLSTDRDEMSNLYSGTPNQHAIKYINAPYIFAGRKKTNIFSPEKFEKYGTNKRQQNKSQIMEKQWDRADFWHHCNKLYCVIPE